jgi:signal transduction histidine kinase
VEVVPIAAPAVRHDLRHEDVARIVHDFKGPLSTIALEAGLLGERFACGDPVDMAGTVGRIARNVEFLDRLVMDLLDLCELETGHFVLRRVPTELRLLLDTVIARSVASRDRDRVFLVAPDEVTIEVDDLRIQRVVANLLHNALKYAPAASGIVIRLEREAAVVRVSVSDAGHGLSDLELEHVFDEYRGDRRALAHEGTGIGLFLSKQIVEAHGARMGVDRVRGEGTRFFFELPVVS